MTELQPEGRQIEAAAFTAGFFGAALLILLAFGWPRPVLDWMRVITPRDGYLAPAEVAPRVALALATLTMLLGAAVLGGVWLLQRLQVSRRSTSLLLVMAATFALAFGAEALSQVIRAWGNLTASDAAGLLIDNGSLTAHGWETIARRAIVASIFAAFLAAAFRLVRSIQAGRST
jgi:hypothetical protein